MFKKLSTNSYGYVKNGKFFELKRGQIGVLGFGECWRLYGADRRVLACFVTKTDGYKYEKRCEGGRLWNEAEMLERASEVANTFVGLFE